MLRDRSRDIRQQAMLTLAQAAERAGTARSTIFRWIRSGRLSATKLDGGTYRIDPAELMRVLDSLRVAATEGAGVAKAPAERLATSRFAEDATDATELRLANARLEAELASLRELLGAEKRRTAELLEAERRRAAELRQDRDDARAERDRWAAQAERLALAPPAAPRVSFIRRLFG